MNGNDNLKMMFDLGVDFIMSDDPGEVKLARDSSVKLVFEKK